MVKPFLCIDTSQRGAESISDEIRPQRPTPMSCPPHCLQTPGIPSSHHEIRPGRLNLVCTLDRMPSHDVGMSSREFIGKPCASLESLVFRSGLRDALRPSEDWWRMTTAGNHTCLFLRHGDYFHLRRASLCIRFGSITNSFTSYYVYNSSLDSTMRSAPT